MFVLNWKLAVLNFLMVSTLLLYNYHQAKDRQEQSGKNHFKNIKLLRVYNEIIRYVKELKAIGAEKYAVSQYEFFMVSMNKTVKCLLKLEQKNSIFSSGHTVLREVCFLGAGGWMIISGSLTVGGLMAFLGYAGNSACTSHLVCKNFM